MKSLLQRRPFKSPLMKQLAIRLGYQKTIAESLVISPLFTRKGHAGGYPAALQRPSRSQSGETAGLEFLAMPHHNPVPSVVLGGEQCLVGTCDDFFHARDVGAAGYAE